MPQLSPAAWLKRLEHRLHQRWNALSVYDAYYEGDHKLAFATAKWNEAFGSTFAKITDNFMPILVEASAERMEVQGFRFGKNQEADDAAWDIWQANDLDAAADEVQMEAIKLREAYWLVQPPAARSDDPPRITGEHPSQTIVACAPGDRRVRLAALKKWVDEDGFAYANVYLPEQVVKYRSQQPLQATGGMYGGQVNWGAGNAIANPLGEVPIIPVPNSPSMLRGGRSDLEGGPIFLQNGINKILSDLLIGSEYQAFPQRVLLGVEIPKDEQGQPVRSAELQSSQSRLWTFGNENAKVAEFSAAELKNYIEAKDALLEDLASQGRLPAPYVKAHIVNASAEALKMAQDGLISRVKRKMKPMGDRHEDMMRLSFKSMGDDQKAKEFKAETIWRDPETRSQAELADALTKLKTINVPDEILWEKYGFSPQEIDRMKTLQEADALLAATLAPVAPPIAPTSGAQPNGSQPAVLTGN